MKKSIFLLENSSISQLFLFDKLVSGQGLNENLNENFNKLLQNSELNTDPRTQEVTRDCQYNFDKFVSGHGL
jgi:hypothetical protein